MSLLQLPAEILVQVFDHVGSSYFCEDLGRLTVCRQWLYFAHTACFKDIRLSQKNLRRLLSSRDAERGLRLIKDSLEILRLEMKGFEDWNSLPESESQGYQGYSQAAGAILEIPFWIESQGIALLTTWTTALNNDLTQLAITAKESQKLRIMRIQTLSERHPLLPLRPRRNYLSSSTMRALLSMKQLTVLELDLCGTLLMPQGDFPDDFHVCTTIGALLTTLRRLRLRMRRLCADALRPQNHDIILRLSEVVVNLSLYEDGPVIMTPSHSSQCGVSGGSVLQLNVDIENQAKALATHMVSPKTIRVLTHTLPQFKMKSLDVLTGRCMILDDDAAWEDDGKSVEDGVDSEESEINDDISTSSDEQ